MKTPVIRFTGSPDSDPAQWLRINELTEQPGPGSAYKVTIEALTTVTPAQILRTGYELAVRHDAPADMRARLFAAAVEAAQPASWSWPLFEHMSRSHGITLTDSEIGDIMAISEKMKEKLK